MDISRGVRILAKTRESTITILESWRECHCHGLEARKSADTLILAEQGRWYTAIVRPLLALPVIIYLWKMIVWDKVLACGTTDALAGDVAAWAAGSLLSISGPLLGDPLEIIRHQLPSALERDREILRRDPVKRVDQAA